LQISYTESESKKEEIQSSETKQEYTYTISVKN